MIPLTPITISGMITIVSLICTMTFGSLIKKGPTYFKIHGVFSVITIIAALTHAYLVLSRYL